MHITNILDMKTLLMGNVVCTFICVVVLAILWRSNHRRFPATEYWLRNMVLQFSGLLLIVLRGTIPDFLSIMLSGLMIITGVMLIFTEAVLHFLPKVWLDLAQVIHLYEAVLATLAIIVWHFYFVMFNPDSYPLNTAFWTGHLSHKEMEEEHPLELERILEAEEKERAKAEMAEAEGDAKGLEKPKA